MAKVYAITCYKTDKQTGKRQEYMANSAVWRKREDALAEAERHANQFKGGQVTPIRQYNTQNGKTRIIAYQWDNETTSFQYAVYEWPVL